MKKSLNESILYNLILERELCLARITNTTNVLQELEKQISEQRKIVTNEKNDNIQRSIEK